MTTATATPTRTVEHAGTHRLNGANLLRSEAIKVTTLRSTWWSLGIALVLSLAISCLIAASSRDFPNPLPP
ncbi:MAG TPA: ABC transporter permease, partial [Microbacterium sp.]|nr:ABC transporter permease [Microbacterium sp.]